MKIPIYYEEPSDWKDLQKKVAKIFLDMGYETEIEKDINLVRGNVNVDVFAAKMQYPKEVIIIECKHWAENIPQTIIHSVRTILSDSGANSGYIISKSGFQKGAYEAVKNSNLCLLTFNEFQNEFRTKWLDCVVNELESLGYPLRKYSDPMESFFDKDIDLLSHDKQIEFKKLTYKYHYISMKSFRLLYKNALSGELELKYIDDVVSKNSKDFPENIKVNCLMDYFQFLKSVCINGVKEFDDLFEKKLRKY